MPICADCHQQNPTGARFCNACGAPLVTAAAPVGEVRKTVTAVLCDVVGSTPLGERLNAEALRRVMGQYFAQMRDAVEQHGGRVEKFIGDAVVGVFGVPVLHEDDALRAVRAANEMRTRLSGLNRSLEGEWGVQLQVRIGVSTGEIVVGSADAALLGDVMNTAARLEQAAEAGEILIGGSTRRLVGNAITAEHAGDRDLRGKRSPVTAFRLLAIDPRGELGFRRFDLRLVGREDELALLRQAYRRAVLELRSVLATVVGFPGVGKSRLALEFTESIAGEVRVLAGHCRSYGEGITYWPVAAIVRAAVGDDLRRGLANALEGEPDADRVADSVAGLLGEEHAVGTADEAFWALRRLFEALAAERPLILVFEDIHWAEPTLLDLIEYLADRIHGQSVLLLCLARPELLDDHPAWGASRANVVSLVLGSLSESESNLMLDERLEGRTIAPDVRARITTSAQGVPLFLEQMLAMLKERETVGVDDVPPVISALLAARLESLDRAECVLLERASVEGERFHARAVATLCETGQPQVEGLLGDLVRRELVQVDEPDESGDHRFRFGHALIRDAAYERLPRADRARLHEQLSEWLDQHQAGDELVGYHLEQAYRSWDALGPTGDHAAGLARRASRLLAGAGRRAHDRGDYTAGANLLERAADLLPRDDPERIALLPELGVLLSEVDVARAVPMLAEAILAARASGNPQVEWESIVIRSRVLFYTDPAARPPADVLAEAEVATEHLEALGDSWGVASALILRADMHLMFGELSRCHELCLRAATLGQGPVRTRAICNAAFGLCRGRLPAHDIETTCLELVGAAGENRRARASVLAELGWARALQGRLDEGIQVASGGRDALAELGVVAWLGSATLACGYIELLRGDVARAELEFAHAQRTFVALDDEWSVVEAVVQRALALCALGRHAEAPDACDSPRTPDEPDWVINWNRVHALVHAAQGAYEPALAHADTAVRAAQPTEYLNFHAAALADRATILEQLGREAEALSDLRGSIVLYDQKGNVIDRDRVRRRLEARIAHDTHR